MDTKLYIAQPSFSGRPDIETQQALVASLLELQAAGIDADLRPSVGNSILPMVRNRYVTDFLAGDCTHLLMIDDDLAWEDGAIIRLLSHGKDLVGGVYPKRQAKLEFPVRRKPGAQIDLKTGLLEVQRIPAGFMMMSRRCLVAMVEHYAHLKYYDRGARDSYSHALFWNELWPGVDGCPEGSLEVWGEDFTFCKRWQDMGGQVFLDTLLTFKHIGRMDWEGCYAESMPMLAMFEAAA